MNDKNIKTNTINNKTNTDKITEEKFYSANLNKKNNITNLSFSIIKDSLDYYDKYQPKVQKILSKI